MTDRVGQLVLAVCGRFVFAAILTSAVAITGCAGSSSRNTTTVESGGTMTGPKDTGSFPNLNIKPQNAATQFTEDEKNAKLAQLAAARANAQSHPGDPAAATDAAEVEKLKASHAKNALKQIGAKCDPALDPNCK
ncbi:hypothetical protein [Mesorhizobium retamae]|uniref:Secreted protein n=1 Tax=Mesorhizobium retamae TaxID=2912854 RepID=A0ABS9QGZ8_9HYPH|nr:hypothetical protein [Mesorhizobium sp. IRAMC:0171]MCG7506667.1 hypothetical protein [Mesorhizobium sp. IRAMC:0171]